MIRPLADPDLGLAPGYRRIRARVTTPPVAPAWRLRTWRRTAHLTQQQVADLLGCTSRQVRRYETGEAAVPDRVLALTTTDPAA
ncbi:XRE family transcriptional regulator [Micromonospora sp. KC207]|uniref:helix-turn-helix domain-containing protein n=1 Tax=Micromonospora sp. KC207 TaxID=2530377 RepID=UPI00104D4805|nr:helix-turn-helix transcriptional regulator [Micromonospora sp. KC207]TDC63897.1 XRE family transcriptional regulator [Micromonospora sp. KC207]